MTRSRTAVITGGCSGIGRAIAERFVADGCTVVVGDLNPVDIPGCEVVKCDVTREDDVEALVAAAGPGVDIGVNCAGLGTLGPVTDLTVDQWDLVHDVCMKGVFLATKHEARAMKANDTHGVIVNIASINARQPAQGMSAYCSAKAGVEMFTRVAAMELGPAGIRVCGIGPGLIDTPLTQYQRDVPAFREGYLEQIPMGRVGTVDDIAKACAYLVSDDASWVSGDTLFVDGASLTGGYPKMLDIVDRLMSG
ncbi:MAG TPA: SDR family oxidoreductase [Acidimicrobiales bacterium]|nr:SDR family oxidoreductase [Acidimicrobiales bacterium]